MKLVLPSHGGELPPEIVATYLHLSLSNSNGVLRKIINTGHLAIQAVCDGSPSTACNKSILNKKINDAYRGNTRFKLKVTSLNPDLKFIFADAKGAASKRSELSDLYGAGFNDSDDPDCQLYYSIKENVIEKLVIVVSLNSPELKQRLCLALQLSQGLGLSLPYDMPFSKIWKQAPDGLPDGQKAFTDDDVSKLTQSYMILSYIHLCPEIRPGMKATDIRRLLVGSSSCLDGLKFIPAQNN